MNAAFTHLRVILIGGSSHAGKTTLALALASRLGWGCRSTDKLAKHPGRPWRAPPKAVPEHVAAHYLTLSADELIADVLRHYRDTVWPLVEAIIETHAADASTECLVLEGSAIFPEMVATLRRDNLAAVWLTGGNEFLERRIHRESGYAERSDAEKTMIDAFAQRTARFNERTITAVERLGLARVNVEAWTDANELAGACVLELAKPGFRMQGQPPPHDDGTPFFPTFEQG